MYPLTTKIFHLGTTLLLSAAVFTTASTPSSANPARTNRDSQILPYLLDQPHDNSVVRVRCAPQEQKDGNRHRRLIRESLLQPNWGDRQQNITIEVAGSCRHVKIQVRDDAQFSDFPVDHPEFNDSWLTRRGSGWYWLLRDR
ncbi:hypothetical protein [Fortiea contorta]|uniref:hypothetical protein n=1 Tax=Fortiea contorta TaxID=1892405 RepID=UPI000344BC92|nr:hypothetical protein [Fortiea contorta]